MGGLIYPHWVDYYVNKVLSSNILDFHSVFISKLHLHCLSECEVLMLSSNRMLVAFFKVTCIHWIQLNEHADIIFIPSTWSDDWPALYLLYLSLSLWKTLCTNKFEQYMMRRLGVDKFVRVRFSLWKWVPTNQNALKSQSAKGPWELGSIECIFCRSLYV